MHRLPAHCKLVALFAFVFLVVATPRTAWWAYPLYGLPLVAVAASARVPAGFLLPRMLVEVPFVVFALLLPFVAEGPRVEVVGLSLSEPGLWGAWNVLAKGTLGVVAALLLAATTEIRYVLLGLERLRLPKPMVQIATFMVRYLDVVAEELRRMRIARVSRGFAARGPRQWGVLARTAGALFVRSYERGERVYLAMVSRGYTGNMPALDHPGGTPASPRQWAQAALPPTAALPVCLLGWLL